MIFSRIHYHNFTRKELLAEEVIVIALICAIGMAAFAAEALLPVRAKIVRCITQEERIQMCHEHSFCCELIDMADFKNESMRQKPQMAVPLFSQHSDTE